MTGEVVCTSRLLGEKGELGSCPRVVLNGEHEDGGGGNEYL